MIISMVTFDHFDRAHFSVGLSNLSFWSKSYCGNDISVRQRPLLSCTILSSYLPPPWLPDHPWHRLGIQVQQDPSVEMKRFSRIDIRELAEHFGQFGPDQMIGIANDLTPHYWARCVLSSALSFHIFLMVVLVGFLALNVAVVVQTENNCGCVLTANKTFPPINITKTVPPLVHQS